MSSDLIPPGVSFRELQDVAAMSGMRLCMDQRGPYILLESGGDPYGEPLYAIDSDEIIRDLVRIAKKEAPNA